MEKSDTPLPAIVAAACEHSPAGCLVTDRTGVIAYVNASVVRMFGYDRGELLGKPVEILVPEAQGPAHARSRQRFFEHASARSMGGGAVLNGRRKDGVIVPLEIGLTPITVDGESFAIAALVDVSARLAAERRAEQGELRLAQSQKLETLGTLAGGISHDFNNILLAILGYAELLKVSPRTDADSIGDLDAILEAATRGRELVKSILGFARHREGHRESLQIASVVAESRRLLKGTLPRSIKLTIDADPAAPAVLADATEIHQILMNLATNAVAAMPQGGSLKILVEPVQIEADEARTIPGAKAGLFVAIVVSDNGTGMSGAVKARALEPFFTTKREGQGTGMGLSVVRDIVSALSGFIELRSDLAVGTSVRVCIPAHIRGQRPLEQTPPIPVHFRALWVDDEPTLAVLVQRLLAKLGFEVSVHSSSLQALAEFQASPDAFDLVVSDNTMPHLSGLAFLSAVHALRPEVPTLMVSGRGVFLSAAELTTHGVRRVLAKPFNIGELNTVVRELVPGVEGI